MCTSVACQSPLYGDCRWPEKVVKGIYITFCTPPWLYTEMFDSILSHYGMKIVQMYFDSMVIGNNSDVMTWLDGSKKVCKKILMEFLNCNTILSVFGATNDP